MTVTRIPQQSVKKSVVRIRSVPGSRTLTLNATCLQSAVNLLSKIDLLYRSLNFAFLRCQGCVSGPTSPDFATCPWPPNPDSTTTSTSKSSTPTTPTTKPTTKPTTPSTTSTSTTSTTPSTSSTPLQDCNDIVKNELCDWDYALISYYDHVMVASECQNICRSVNGAR